MQVIDKCLQGLGVLAPLSLLVGGALLGEQLQALQRRQRLRLKTVAELIDHRLCGRLGDRHAGRRHRGDRGRFALRHAITLAGRARDRKG